MGDKVKHRQIDEYTDQFTCGDHRVRITRNIGEDGSVDITYTRRGAWGRFRDAESTIIPGAFLVGTTGDAVLQALRGAR